MIHVDAQMPAELSPAPNTALATWSKYRSNIHNTAMSNSGGSNSVQKWSSALKAGPAVFGSDGTLYVGTQDQKVYALNPDGSTLWVFVTQDTVDGSPAIGTDGTIYFGCGDSHLYALNPDGTQKWSFATQGPIVSSPAIAVDGTIYVGSFDSKLYAVNPDGTSKWIFTPPIGSTIYGSPAIGNDGTIYFGSMDLNIYAVNPDGTQKWAYETGWNVPASPSIGTDGTIYIASQDDKLYAFNPDGTIKWTFLTQCGGNTSPAIGSDGTIYLGDTQGNFYAINPSGTEKWNVSTSGQTTDAAIGVDGTIYICSDNTLLAIDPTGTQLWSKTVSSDPSGPTIGPDGTIFVGSLSGSSFMFGTQVANIPVASLSFSPSSVVSGKNTLGYLSLSSVAPAGGAVVYLSSDQSSVLVPALVTIPSGSSTATFQVASVPVTSSVTANISASSSGATLASQVTAMPSQLASLLLDPPQTNGDTIVVGTVNLNGPAPDGGLTVSLTSEYPSSVLVPSTVVVPEGHSSVLFAIEILEIPTSTYANLISASDSHTVQTATLEVSPQALQYGSPWPKQSGNAKNSGMGLGGGSNGTTRWSLSQSTSAAVIASDGTIYAGSPTAVSGSYYVYAFQSDGTLKWSFTTLGAVATSPALGSDGTIYAVSQTGNLYSIHPDGTLNWRYDTGGTLACSPALGADGTIYFGDSSGSNFYALNQDGTVKWINSTVSGMAIGSSAAIGSDGTIYFGNLNDALCAVSKNGATEWTFDTGASINASPSIATDGTIFIGSTNNKLYAVHPDGTLKWTFTTASSIKAAAAIANDGTIYVGCVGGQVYGIHPDGTERASYLLGTGFQTDIVLGVDGTVYACATTGSLIAFDANLSPQWGTPVGASPTSPSIASDGAIFVGSASSNSNLVGTQVSNIPISTLALSSASVSGGGSLTGTVTLSSVAPAGGCVVYLDVSDESVTVPALIIVAAGESTQTFPIDTKTVEFDIVATIFAFSGETTGSATLTVLEPSVTALSLASASICSRSQTVATVTLSSPAPQGGWPLSITCGTPDLVDCVSSLTVPQGASTASFVINAYHVYRATATNLISVSDGQSSASATLTLTPQGTQVGSPWPNSNGNSFGSGLGLGGGCNGLTGLTIATTGTNCVIGADGTLYIGGTDNNLYALSPSGAVNWSYSVSNQILSAPTIGADGTIYFGCTDGHLYALNHDGSLKWQFDASSAINASPSIGVDGTIYFGADNHHFFGLHPDGSFNWLFGTTGSFAGWSPSIAGDGTVICSNAENKVYAFIPGSGYQKWSYAAGGILSPGLAIASDGTVYVGCSDNNLYAIASDGTLKWKFLTQGPIQSSPSIGLDGTIYVGSNDQYVYAVHTDGTQKWAYPTGGTVTNSLAIGSDGTIYATSNLNTLTALNVDGTAQWTVPISADNQSPSIGRDGTVYVFSRTGASRSVGQQSTANAVDSIETSQTVVTGGASISNRVVLTDFPPAGGSEILVSATNLAAGTPAFYNGLYGQVQCLSFTTLPVAIETDVTIGFTGGGSTVNLSITVLPPVVSNLLLSASQVFGGDSATGTVFLSGPAPVEGVLVFLDCQYPDLVELPDSVWVPAGANSVSFSISTQGPLDRPFLCLISATSGGATQTATIEINSHAVSSVVMSQSALVGDLTSIGTVNLWSPAPAGGVVVSLTSSNPALLAVPSSVTILAGSSSATFNATTYPVATDTAVVITASSSDGTVQTAVTVQAPSLISFTLASSTIVGAGSTTGTVVLNGQAPAGGMVVALSSQWPTYVSCPTSCTVPAGATSVTFPISSGAVWQVPFTDQITASLRTVVINAPLTVNTYALESVSVSPSTVLAGGTVTGTLTLWGPAPAGGWTITLVSGSPVYVPLPTTVVIPEGQSSGTFNFTVQLACPTETCLISAHDAVIYHSTNLYVLGDSIIGLSVSPSTIGAGQSATGTVTLKAAAPAGGWTINLAAGVPGEVTVPASIVIPAGATTGNFAITTRVSSSTVTSGIYATDATSSKSTSLTVVGDSISNLSVSPTTIGGNGTATGTVTLASPAPVGGWLVNLSVGVPGVLSVPSSIIVPEGSTTATFTLTGKQNVATFTSGVYASDGNSAKSTGITVVGDQVASISVSPSSVTAAQTATGTVVLNSAAPYGGWLINLSAGVPGDLTMPSTLLIPAGATSATFPIVTKVISGTVNCGIYAADGTTSRSTILTINGDSISGVTVSPSSVPGGTGATGTVNLLSAAPAGGWPVQLSVGVPSVVGVPASVVVPAGATSVNFAITTTAVASTLTSLIFATDGNSGGSTNLTVTH